MSDLSSKVGDDVEINDLMRPQFRGQGQLNDYRQVRMMDRAETAAACASRSNGRMAQVGFIAFKRD